MNATSLRTFGPVQILICCLLAVLIFSTATSVCQEVGEFSQRLLKNQGNPLAKNIPLTILQNGKTELNEGISSLAIEGDKLIEQVLKYKAEPSSNNAKKLLTSIRSISRFGVQFAENQVGLTRKLSSVCSGLSAHCFAEAKSLESTLERLDRQSSEFATREDRIKTKFETFGLGLSEINAISDEERESLVKLMTDSKFAVFGKKVTDVELTNTEAAIRRFQSLGSYFGSMKNYFLDLEATYRTHGNSFRLLADFADRMDGLNEKAGAFVEEAQIIGEISRDSTSTESAISGLFEEYFPDELTLVNEHQFVEAPTIWSRIRDFFGIDHGKNDDFEPINVINPEE